MKVIISNYREFLDARFDRQRSIYEELQQKVVDNFKKNIIENVVLVDYKEDGHALFELYSYDAHGSVILYSFTGTAS